MLSIVTSSLNVEQKTFLSKETLAFTFHQSQFSWPAFSLLGSDRFHNCHYLIHQFGNLDIFINALWQRLCALDLKIWYQVVCELHSIALQLFIKHSALFFLNVFWEETDLNLKVETFFTRNIVLCMCIVLSNKRNFFIAL